MANIKLKPIDQLELWDRKELRKLRMTIRNRIESLNSRSKPKALSESHPLFEMEVSECTNLLDKVIRAEKLL